MMLTSSCTQYELPIPARDPVANESPTREPGGLHNGQAQRRLNSSEEKLYRSRLAGDQFRIFSNFADKYLLLLFWCEVTDNSVLSIKQMLDASICDAFAGCVTMRAE